MKLTLISSACLALLVSCTPTGDWNEDTIMFSPPLADKRLAEMHRKLDRINGETARSRQKTSALKAELQAASARRSTSQAGYDSIRSQIAALESSLAKSQSELDAIRSQDSVINQRVGALEKTIAVESAELANLRSTLILATQNR